MKLAASRDTRALVRAVLSCTVLALIGGESRAEPTPTRVFSSLCTEADGSDISGFRIRISGTVPNVTVSFEETEGALMAASDTRDVDFSAATGDLSFKVVTEAGSVAFRGHVSPMALDGTLTRAGEAPETVHLPSDAGGEGEGACPLAPDAAKP